MPHICPRPCSRLATAAVFISVGVIQFIVGIILLKSKYVYLLSFPDFWTSLSNISVGCLLGLSASIWKDSRKKRATKYIVRRNLLTALMLTALLMNATTAGILILGEGNTLLSIQLENSGKPGTASLAGEILAYAYATSVCSPIICIVVAIVFVSGNCFQNSTPKEQKTPKTPEKVWNAELPHHNWVYSPDLMKPHTYTPKQVSSSSESSLSSADELCMDPIPVSDIALYKKYVDPRTQEILYTKVVAGGNRGAMSDGRIPKQFLPAPCMHAECLTGRAGSYEGPTSPWKGELCLYEKVPQRNSLASSKISNRKRSRSFNRQLLESKLSGLSTSSDEVFKDILRRNSQMAHYFKDSEIHRKRPNSNIETANEYQNIYMKQFANSQFDGLSQLQRSRRSYPGMAVRSNLMSSREEPSLTEAVVHEDLSQFHNPILTDDEFLALQDPTLTKGPGKRSSSVTFEDKQIFHKDSCDSEPISVSISEYARRQEVFSDESETGADSSFDMSKSSPLVGKLVPIRINSSTKKSPKLIPVPSPKAPISGERCKSNGYLASECEIEEGGESVQKKLANRDSKLLSFKDNSKNMKDKKPESASGTSKNQHAKKLDLVCRTSSMEPISEVPTEETNSEVHMDTSVPNSSYVSSPEGNYNINVSSEAEKITKDISVEDSPSASTPVPANASSNNSKRFEDSLSKSESSSMKLDKTPQNILRKLWSSVGSDVKLEFLDQIVDDDSLIGLSEEDLIARQLRTRSLRKAVQQRMKQKGEE